MAPVHVVGIGLDGAAGLSETVQTIVAEATLLVGSDRHLSYFPRHPAQRLLLGNLHDTIQNIRHALATHAAIVVLASGDPLFFGIGRILLAELSPEFLTFHPHLSAVQLAFSRVKSSWQDARIISAHGRSLEELTQALQQGTAKLAVLTDNTNTPGAIAHLLRQLDLPSPYEIWVCEDLGGDTERVRSFTPETLIEESFAPLNVVILLRHIRLEALDLAALPALGLPDSCFLSFADRPGLITKREVRLLILGELALQPAQMIWDVGAGTGSVSIEIARLFPQSQVYAIEKTAAGSNLIQQNQQRFRVENITAIHGAAPAAFEALPAPDRVFIGGSGGNLDQILSRCQEKLRPQGVMVLAIATLEHLHKAMSWIEQQAPTWESRLLQVNLARSVPIAALTRFSPLNPVTLLTLTQAKKHRSGYQ
jgi:precorrin-6B C5,15-methyltransferase / cobalt-precorrin-6B C5,C15-methyltransferase